MRLAFNLCFSGTLCLTGKQVERDRRVYVLAACHGISKKKGKSGASDISVLQPGIPQFTYYSSAGAQTIIETRGM